MGDATRAGRGPPPAERVRERIRREFGDPIAERLPSGYQRLGSVLVLRLPEGLDRIHAALGEAWRAELGVETVLARWGPISGEFRTPATVRLSGSTAVTEVVEHAIRYRLDAERLMFAEGNRTERHRFGRLVRPGETVVDLFAGIGYFTLPALVEGRAGRVLATEKNPTAFRYLTENLALNRVADRARTWCADNREADLPFASADRIVLGYLPSALPWIPRALELLRPEGGTLHVHLVVGTRAGCPGARALVEEAIERAGGRRDGPIAAREVKPYGPGRMHAVVDVAVRGPSPTRERSAPNRAGSPP